LQRYEKLLKYQKKYIILLLLVLAWQINAQASEMCSRKNELKIDIAYPFLSPTIKVEYEYLLNDRSSAGVAISYMFDFYPVSKIARYLELDYKMQLFGTYRLYFGKKPASGFFLEGHMGLILIEGHEGGVNPPSSGGGFSLKKPNSLDTSIGAALGWKFHLPKSRVMLDLFVGIGSFNLAESGYFRTGICIGKRF